MTTKPSDAPWADEPYELITTPLKYKDVNSHSAVWCASEMAYSHNCLLRGLNAILQQAPHIHRSQSPAYNPQDVKDLLFYVESWVKMVDHHHHTEETTIFPSIEKMAGQPGLLSGPMHQHEEFHDGLLQLKDYAHDMQNSPEKYEWLQMKGIIDGFVESLVRHLREEIDVFLGFTDLDSDGLRRSWDEGEAKAKASGELALLYDVFPVVLGCCDKTYEGGNQFPPLPGVMRYAVKYWFGTWTPGAWRLNPCDFWGQPRELQMLPKN